MDDIAVLIGREVVGAHAVDDGLFKLRDEGLASDGRVDGCGEERVRAAGVDSGEGAGGEAAESVGFEPFAGCELGEILHGGDWSMRQRKGDSAAASVQVSANG